MSCLRSTSFLARGVEVKKKIKMGQLQSLFTEGAIARILKEEDDSMAHEAGASGDSLDAQVDRYLGQYESSAKKSDGDLDSPGNDLSTSGADVDQMESIDWRDLIKGRLIEAGEGDKDDENDEENAAPGADAMMDQVPDKPGLDKLNIESFANDVARMIENYDSLLEIRSTLLRRARAFLMKNYDDEVVKAFEDSMRDDHGMEAGVGSQDLAIDKFVAPAADRANGSAAPGAGGSPA